MYHEDSPGQDRLRNCMDCLGTRKVAVTEISQGASRRAEGVVMGTPGTSRRRACILLTAIHRHQFEDVLLISSHLSSFVRGGFVTMRRGFLNATPGTTNTPSNPTPSPPSYYKMASIASRTIKPTMKRPTTLTSEILPLVAAHLKPGKKAQLATLLVIQRSSKYGWQVATPILYRHITVRGWNTLLRLPDGLHVDASLILARQEDCDITIKVSLAQQRSLERRLKAFDYV